ncbi:MAG TPA: saccharopine dehydrogenase C-terminal domain-containing protein, partial [Flavobacterium sp.]|nr:saccharopine dehydrogenase C-terminal domain-containing protein [Flavobacterium sp.]
SQMVVIGDDRTYTAMAKTVGLPVAIAALMILNGTISTPGVQLPLRPDVYEPILAELATYGVRFAEKDITL